jgi:ATP-binding cassette subfamily B protein
MDSSIQAQSITVILWPLVTLAMNLSVIAVLWFGGNMVNTGSLEIGKIMAFINYLIQIMNSLNMMLMIIISISRAKVSAARINEVLDTEASIVEAKNPKSIENYDIEFKDVCFKYNKDSENVLNNLSFKINEGEKVGIIGATGSGKSSLISLIPRLYDVTSGQVLIGGTDVREVSEKELGRFTDFLCNIDQLHES